ncbi:hypothetical protein [Cystobacter ferrugineus]|uniref:Lipoprotein n=1 Tax=Cystobacter ferrugineus TaxID=83449 RepID=A0A1L9B2I7_9BACT|nr:hypothetical protein [Cystobacter ferrugineus]OJH36464.1 hypothetical protein BON30_32380 [Cystobacter ferrugineus]
MIRATLLTMFVSTGCLAEPHVTPAPPKLDGDAPDLAQRIAAAKANVLADTCFQTEQDASVCDWGDFAYDPSQFAMTQSTNEAILIVDGFSELPFRAIRYQNRLKGFFRVGEGGEFSPVSFSWHAPVVLHETLRGFADPDLIPAESLRELGGPLTDVYGPYALNAGHGSYVFSILVEANPRQPIVILDHLRYDKFALEEFCDGSGTDASISRLREKSRVVAANLQWLMAEQNVRFVNVSAGESLDTMRELWTSRCRGIRPSDSILRKKLNAYAPIVEALYKTPGVFAAQASINASNSQDFPFDYPSPSYPNRVLAGFFTTLNSGLDEKGRKDGTSSTTLSGWPGRQNVDIYLNSGVQPNRPFRYNTTPLLQVDSFGVDIYPITQTTTSWIAPLALSRFIHLRYERFGAEEMSDDLISRIRSEMTPGECPEQPESNCAYQDPLKHGQIEAVRLGYRALEYVEPDSQQSTLSRRMEYSQ